MERGGFGHVWWGSGGLRACRVGGCVYRLAVCPGLRRSSINKRARISDLRVWYRGRRRRRSPDGDRESNPVANAHSYRSAHSGSSDRYHICQCAAVRPAGPDSDPDRSDLAKHWMLDRGRLQVRAFSRSGSGSQNLRWGRQRFLDLDCRNANHSRSMADNRHLRVSQRPDLHRRHLAPPITSSKEPAALAMAVGIDAFSRLFITTGRPDLKTPPTFP